MPLFTGSPVLFAGSKVYISDKVYPLGELTAEILNYPDEKLIDLRYAADMMLTFTEENFYNSKTTKDRKRQSKRHLPKGLKT